MSLYVPRSTEFPLKSRRVFGLCASSSVCFKSNSAWKMELFPDELAPKISVNGRIGILTFSPNALKFANCNSRSMGSCSGSVAYLVAWGLRNSRAIPVGLVV